MPPFRLQHLARSAQTGLMDTFLVTAVDSRTRVTIAEQVGELPLDDRL